MSKNSAPAQLQKNREDTLPKLLVRNYNHWTDKRVAMRKKEQGVWKERSWLDFYERVKAIFAGVTDLGLATGDNVAILGDNNPEWFCCQLAVQACGGAVVGVNPARTVEQTKLILEQSLPKFAFVQDQEQVDKLLEIKESIPSIEKIVYWNDKGLKHYSDPLLISQRDLIERGQEALKGSKVDFEERLSHGNGDDIAMLLCIWKSSDTVELMPFTHSLIISSGETVIAKNPVKDKHEYVCVMNPGWIFEQILGFSVSLLTGRRLNFAESGETAEVDLREVSPHTLAYPSQMWDQLGLAIQSNMRGGTNIKRGLFNWGLWLGYKITDLSLSGRRVNPMLKFARGFAWFLAYRPLRDKHGLDRTKVAYAAGGVVAPETLRFFHAIGVNLKQIFASREDGVVFNDPGENRIEQ